jgi:hypothetical protein
MILVAIQARTKPVPDSILTLDVQGLECAALSQYGTLEAI